MTPPILPKLGMGTAGLGNLYRMVPSHVARQTVQRALEAGITYFDTAPYYGFGLAETRLGTALAELDPSAKITISTKVGRLLRPTGATGERHGFVDAAPYEPVFDYSYDGVLRSHTESLRRLRRDRADILLAHDIGMATHGDRHHEYLRQFLDGGYPAMRALREQGAVDAIGIGVNEVGICEELVGQIDLDIVLIAGRLTLLDQSAAERVLDLCQRHEVAVIIGGPYNSGILATEPDHTPLAPIRYDYADAPAEMIERARRIAAVTKRHGIDLPTAALLFPLRFPAVASVIPGLVGHAEVDATARRFATAVPDALWAELGDAGLLSMAAASGIKEDRHD